MPEVGIEPTRANAHWILSPARLPVPPLRHINFNIEKPPSYIKLFINFFIEYNHKNVNERLNNEGDM